ncbi:molybdopterin-dependent oxidoreductase [Helicobacter sp. 13S00477-4]|uniref:molybdopterin-dependent oxidoreductase n=1 Tax=Helicobacter sp. 13S00477-4 TaxID=1905759 RepID=UPI000BC38964|nr:molybdopterin-dependent oxidoreductase [Helicobacter sp. 13S00477-4]PAF50676.1 hypothetical protein BKH44_07035 [Helicobacter sp. 13S00477-4]
MLLYSNGSNIMEIYINSQKFSFNPGESILEIARKNNVYIPTLCHLPKLLPVGACRMCVVEEEGGNIIASCKSPAIHGSKIYTHTSKIQQYRQEIMKFLSINHPLECGVCDKSGECELQDKVLETKIPFQSFGAKQRQDDFISFKNKIYDESLCIMCERCARVCNQIVGNNYLQVVAGGYNSKIGINEENYCEDCDECVSVCPTGAMISQRFQYNSNAWELQKISSTCTNCSLGCYIIYETKNTHKTEHISKNKKIYRSNTQMEFAQLCHSGRHNFINFPVWQKNHPAFESAIKAFKNAIAIRIGLQTTNEEAYIINYLKNQLGLKLYCEDARVYQNFVTTLKSISNKPIFDTKNTLKNADMCLSLGSYIFDEMPVLKSQIAQAINSQKMKYIYLHPIVDDRLKKHSHIQYEVNTELGVVALMMANFLKDLHLNEEIADFIQNLDIGYLSSESNISEEELQNLTEIFKKSKNPILFVGHELFYHSHCEDIAYMLGLIEQYTPLKIIILSPGGNATGISLICNLDTDNHNNTNVIGYRTNGEFILNELSEEIIYEENINFAPKIDMILPSLTQLEGTIVNTDYQLMPIFASLPYESYDLCDIAQHFGLKETFLIEFTHKLPPEKGFKSIDYDSLSNYFEKNGEEIRGYKLEQKSFIAKNTKKIKTIDFLPESNGSILFTPKPSGNFLNFDSPKIIGSKQFAIANKIHSHQKVSFNLNGQNFSCDFVEQEYFKGMIAVFDSGKYSISKQKYPYEKITLNNGVKND